MNFDLDEEDKSPMRNSIGARKHASERLPYDTYDTMSYGADVSLMKLEWLVGLRLYPSFTVSLSSFLTYSFSPVHFYCSITSFSLSLATWVLGSTWIEPMI
jgi:hypothetical protein